MFLLCLVHIHLYHHRPVSSDMSFKERRVFEYLVKTVSGFFSSNWVPYLEKGNVGRERAQRT